MAIKSSATRHLNWTLVPFLYPALRAIPIVQRRYGSSSPSTSIEDSKDQASLSYPISSTAEISTAEDIHSNYSSTPFADTCTLTLSAGAGGHGCISFLRDIHISAGPPNGGDGGTGGSIYLQATSSQTSLHKLARRRHISAARGRNGQGKGRGGERGADTVIEVPVGTVVREISRYDPITEAEAEARRVRMLANSTTTTEDNENEDSGSTDLAINSSRKKWLLYPGSLPSTIATEMPIAPKPRRTALHAAEPPMPIHLDLTKPMSKPLLLAAGAAGGLGNPHFMTRALPRPKYATRGEEGTKIDVVLELKLLADVGLVGKPNAGKSTLLRSITKSRARVGDWAFTTLKPNVGTVVIDDGRGWISPIAPVSLSSPQTQSPPSNADSSSNSAAISPSTPPQQRSEQRTHLSIADIPGLIHDAHLDKGLGISFLRHVERARVLAFVVDLSAGDAITAVKSLWREVSMYEALSGMATREAEAVEWSPFSDPSNGHASDSIAAGTANSAAAEFVIPPSGARSTIAGGGGGRGGGISLKPWFVVATKADLEGTQENYQRLKAWLAGVSQGTERLGSTGAVGAATEVREKRWKGEVGIFPVCALRGEGTARIVAWTRSLLEL